MDLLIANPFLDKIPQSFPIHKICIEQEVTQCIIILINSIGIPISITVLQRNSQ